MTKVKKLISIVFCILISVQYALCDWHHHSHSSGGTLDPKFDSFMWTVLFFVSMNALILFGTGIIFIFRTSVIKGPIWKIPLMNLIVYLVSIIIRQYPDGFGGRFYSSGLCYTLIEILIILLISFLVAYILAGIKWIKEKLKEMFKKIKIENK